LAVVLSQQWRALYFDRRILELDRTSGHRELASHRMIHCNDHAALEQMRSLSNSTVSSTAPHGTPASPHELHYFLLRELASEFVDDAREFFERPGAAGVFLEARVVDQFGPPDRFAKRLPREAAL
jgi:hypothetical protein